MLARVNLVSSPEIHTHEWASFSTKDFPENKHAKSGDKVRIVQTDLEDERPVEDVVWTDESYQEVYKEAGLELVKTYKPLAKESEPCRWVNETRIAPWVIYALKKAYGFKITDFLKNNGLPHALTTEKEILRLPHQLLN